MPRYVELQYSRIFLKTHKTFLKGRTDFLDDLQLIAKVLLFVVVITVLKVVVIVVETVEVVVVVVIVVVVVVVVVV